MSFDGGANWNAAVAERCQAPNYFLRVNGYPDQFVLNPVKSASRTEHRVMDLPSGTGSSIDVMRGTRTVSELNVSLLDRDGIATELVATRASGAPLTSLVNREATLYGGYASLVESDYPAIYTGRIRGVKARKGLDGFDLTISDPLFRLNQKVCTTATREYASVLIGNPINIFYALLTGTFSFVGSFPLGAFSGATGLGIDPSLINTAQLVDERDTWWDDALVKVEIPEPAVAKSLFENELFGPFGGWVTISGGGLIGLRFHQPAFATDTLATIGVNDIVDVRSVETMFDYHLNSFALLGDHDVASNDFLTTLYNTAAAEDVADQAATGEVQPLTIESKWVRTEYGGVRLASQLIGRKRRLFLNPPDIIDLVCTFQKRRIEEGDIVEVTHPAVSDMLTGTRGITSKRMMVLSINPDYVRGLLNFRLVEPSYRKYGLIAPTGTPVYGSASTLQKSRYAFIDQDYRAA